MADLNKDLSDVQRATNMVANNGEHIKTPNVGGYTKVAETPVEAPKGTPSAGPVTVDEPEEQKPETDDAAKTQATATSMEHRMAEDNQLRKEDGTLPETPAERRAALDSMENPVAPITGEKAVPKIDMTPAERAAVRYGEEHPAANPLAGKHYDEVNWYNPKSYWNRLTSSKNKKVTW